MPRSIKISIIGAGSGVFSLGLVKDLCLTDNLRESEVCFMDLNPERLDIVHGLAMRYAQERVSQRRPSDAAVERAPVAPDAHVRAGRRRPPGDPGRPRARRTGRALHRLPRHRRTLASG